MPNRLPNFCLIDTKSCLIAIWPKSRGPMRESEICVASDHSRLANVSTEYLKHVKHFNFNFDHGSRFHLRAGPRPVHRFSASTAMHSSESEHSSDDSGAGDDPHRSSAVPNSLLQLQCAYASDSDSAVPLPRKNSRRRTGSPMTQFHTTSQPYKRRCIPSVSLVIESEVRVAKSTFHLIMRHFSRPNYDGQEAGWLNVGNVLMFRCESLLLIYKSLLSFH